MVTVYFDTNFYAWLASATADEADDAVDRLNRAGVRYVLSYLVTAELAQAHGRPEQYERMRRRLQRLKWEPLRLPEEASWALLGGDEATRRETARIMKWSHEQMAVAEASALAIGRMSAGQEAAFRELHGIPEIRTMDETAEFMHKILDPLFEELGAVFAEMGVRMPEPPTEFTPEALTEFEAQLRSEFPLDDAEAMSTLARAMTKTDNRVPQAALGDAAAVRRLGNTLRDSRHAHLFMKNRDVVDFLQIDRAQMRQMQTDPRHPLREAGLASRCFSASDLLDAVTAVEQLDPSRIPT